MHLFTKREFLFLVFLFYQAVCRDLVPCFSLLLNIFIQWKAEVSRTRLTWTCLKLKTQSLKLFSDTAPKLKVVLKLKSSPQSVPRCPQLCTTTLHGWCTSLEGMRKGEWSQTTYPCAVRCTMSAFSILAPCIAAHIPPHALKLDLVGHEVS